MRGQITNKTATLTVNTLADGFLSSANDVAIVDVGELREISLYINRVTSDNEAARASLDFATLGAAGVDTVVEARDFGSGLGITVALVGDRTDGTEVIEEVGTAVTIHVDDDVTTIAEMEAAIDAQSTLIQVKTPGTGATVIDTTADGFTATPLAGGDGGVSLVIEKSIDGVNWSPVGTVDTLSFGEGQGANRSAAVVLRDANSMSLLAKQIKVTLASIQDQTRYSVVAVGEYQPG